jgi:hypothetical protein
MGLNLFRPTSTAKAPPCVAAFALWPVLTASALALPPPSTRNVVLMWNQAALNAIQATRTPPPIAARAIAITHTCMFDAWAAYDDTATGTRFAGVLRRPTSERTQANKEKTVSFAAYRALVDLFPSQKMMKFDPLMNELGFDASDTSGDLRTAIGIGNVACNAVLDIRHRDGANQLGDLHPGTYSDYSGFTPANTSEVLRDPNRWQPLLVNGVAQKWLLPQWGLVTPFAAPNAQFRLAALSEGPYLYPTLNYWKQALDVADLSGRLGDTEKAIAEYWADGFTTVTPPGHWCIFAQTVSRRDNHTLDQDIKLFFILGNALLDSSIAAWDVKRCADSIRPVTVIRALLGGRQIRAWAGPGLGVGTIYGRDFRSYIPTPPFGSYVSGHSVLSAAAAEILRRFTGGDSFGESATIPPGTSLIEPGLTPSTPVKLTWQTFSDAADQAGMSRRYGGIHFEKDDLAGRALGRQVAAQVWAKAATYIAGTTQ